MKKLQMNFFNEVGKKHRWTLKAAKQDLTGEEVQSLMEGIVDIGMFEKNGVPHCTAISDAKYVETTETVLFDVASQVRKK